MKKLIMGLVFAGATAAAFLVTQATTEAASPQVISPIVKVKCLGNNACCSNPTGARNFVYRVVIPGGNHGITVSNLEVGTHDGNIADYVNLLLPAGWTMSIVSGNKRGRIACTAHGGTTFPSEQCPYKLVFSGPAQGSSFSLGYDFIPNWDHHDVAWSSSAVSVNWGKPVGLGWGPLHSPLFP